MAFPVASRPLAWMWLPGKPEPALAFLLSQPTRRSRRCVAPTAVTTKGLLVLSQSFGKLGFEALQLMMIRARIRMGGVPHGAVPLSFPM